MKNLILYIILLLAVTSCEDREYPLKAPSLDDFNAPGEFHEDSVFKTDTLRATVKMCTINRSELDFIKVIDTALTITDKNPLNGKPLSRKTIELRANVLLSKDLHIDIPEEYSDFTIDSIRVFADGGSYVKEAAYTWDPNTSMLHIDYERTIRIIDERNLTKFKTVEEFPYYVGEYPYSSLCRERALSDTEEIHVEFTFKRIDTDFVKIDRYWTKNGKRI